MTKKVKSMNQDLRNAIKESPIYAYMVADVMGMSKSNFYALLQKTLEPSEKERILNAIKQAERKATA